MAGTDAGTRIEAFVESFNGGDVDAVGTMFAREFWAYEPRSDEPGAAHVIHELAVDLRRAMSDLAIEVHAVEPTDAGHRVSITLAGTHDGPLWGAPATRRRVTWPLTVSLRAVGDRFALNLEDVAPPAALGLLRDLEIVNPPDEMDQPTRHPVEFPEILMRLLFTGQMADKPCPHVEQIRVTDPQRYDCASCVESGDVWPALRMCTTCGFVGCCDTSRNRHMKAHHEATGHPLFRSIRMDEAWMWCYDDDAFFGRRRLESARSRGQQGTR